MVFKLQQILDEKKNINSVSFIMAAETNTRQSHIKKIDELILMLSESRTQHDSVDYV